MPFRNRLLPEKIPPYDTLLMLMPERVFQSRFDDRCLPTDPQHVTRVSAMIHQVKIGAVTQDEAHKRSQNRVLRK